MTYSLSTSVIIDTIRSTAAFQIMSASDDRKPLFASLMRDEVRGQLKIMVKNAFAETVLRLLPHVSGCTLDGESANEDPGSQDTLDTSDMILRVTLPPPAGGRDYAGAAVRRQLEQTVVLQAMRLWALAGGDHVAAEAYSTLASSALDTLLCSLATSPRPFLR